MIHDADFTRSTPSTSFSSDAASRNVESPITFSTTTTVTSGIKEESELWDNSLNYSPSPKTIVVASRPSKLALIQTRIAVDAILASQKLNLSQEIAGDPFTSSKSHPAESPPCVLTSFKVLEVLSLGDKKPLESLDSLATLRFSPLYKSGVFTKEIEDCLITGDASIAVHSMKDLPSNVIVNINNEESGQNSSNDIFDYPAILERADPRDAVVVRSGLRAIMRGKLLEQPTMEPIVSFSLDILPPGSIIGTSAVRRKAFIRREYPHLVVENIRGNVDTRLKKLENFREGQQRYDALILAAAGLKRLQLEYLIYGYLDPITFPYSPGQGALVCQCLKCCPTIASLLQQADHLPTRLEVLAERQFTARIHGGCYLPVGVVCQCRLVRKTLADITLVPPTCNSQNSHLFRFGTDSINMFELFLLGQICSPDGNHTCRAFETRWCIVCQEGIADQLIRQNIRTKYDFDLSDILSDTKRILDISKLSPKSASEFDPNLSTLISTPSTVYCCTLDDLFAFVEKVGDYVSTSIFENKQWHKIQTSL